MQLNGRNVKFRSLTAREFFDFQEKHEGSDRSFNMSMMAACIVDENGKPVFTEDTVQDLPLPDFQVAQSEVTKINGPPDDAKKN